MDFDKLNFRDVFYYTVRFDKYNSLVQYSRYIALYIIWSSKNFRIKASKQRVVCVSLYGLFSSCCPSTRKAGSAPLFMSSHPSSLLPPPLPWKDFLFNLNKAKQTLTHIHSKVLLLENCLLSSPVLVMEILNNIFWTLKLGTGNPFFRWSKFSLNLMTKVLL